MPTSWEIKHSRLSIGLTQKQAAKLVCVGLKTWQRWECEGSSHRDMPETAWELWQIKVGLKSI